MHLTRMSALLKLVGRTKEKICYEEESSSECLCGGRCSCGAQEEGRGKEEKGRGGCFSGVCGDRGRRMKFWKDYYDTF